MNSRFFLPSMDSIFDLIFESASAQSSWQVEDSASKKSTAVQTTSVIDLSPSEKRGSLQPFAKAKNIGACLNILESKCSVSPPILETERIQTPIRMQGIAEVRDNLTQMSLCLHLSTCICRIWSTVERLPLAQDVTETGGFPNHSWHCACLFRC